MRTRATTMASSTKLRRNSASRKVLTAPAAGPSGELMRFLSSCQKNIPSAALLSPCSSLPFSRFCSFRLCISILKSSIRLAVRESPTLGHHAVILNSFQCRIYVSPENNRLSLLTFFFFRFFFPLLFPIDAFTNP